MGFKNFTTFIKIHNKREASDLSLDFILNIQFFKIKLTNTILTQEFFWFCSILFVNLT